MSLILRDTKGSRGSSRQARYGLPSTLKNTQGGSSYYMKSNAEDSSRALAPYRSWPGSGRRVSPESAPRFDAGREKSRQIVRGSLLESPWHRFRLYSRGRPNLTLPRALVIAAASSSTPRGRRMCGGDPAVFLAARTARMSSGQLSDSWLSVSSDPLNRQIRKARIYTRGRKYLPSAL